MKKKIMILLALVAVLVVTGSAPLDEDPRIPYRFVIFNETLEKVPVLLEGQGFDKEYLLEAKPGENEYKVLEGTYKYFYESCVRYEQGQDSTYTGDIVVDKPSVRLLIEACPGQPVPSKLAIYSHFEDTVVIDFFGPLEHPNPDDFEVEVELGKNRFEALSGTYQYSFDACDQTFSGEVYVTKNGKTKFYLRSCGIIEVRGIQQEFEVSSPGRFLVANHNVETITVTLIGPQSYLLDVEPGMNRFYNLVPGTYTYIFGFRGERYEGVITIGEDGSSILVVPFPVIPGTE